MDKIPRPIRVGIIGLSAKASWAVVSHLPALLSLPDKYSIVAVCNTSEASSRASIQAHNLPESTKAYGSPEQLASDPDVDLVVVSTNVVLHKQALLPSIRSGKALVCEWPLGKDLAEAEELLAEVKRHGGDVARTAIGLQGRYAAVVRQVADILASGRIGKLQRTTFSAPAGYCGDEEPENHAYFFRAADGGNLITIFLAHVLESVLAGLGGRELGPRFSSLLGAAAGPVRLTDGSGRVVRTVERDTPRSAALLGLLDDGSELSLQLWGGRGAPAPAENVYWRVVGDRGELCVRGPGANLQMGGYDCTVTVLDYATGELQPVALSQDGRVDPVPAINIARLYDKFADGAVGEYPDWEWAVKRHRLVDEIFKRDQMRS